MSVATVCFTTPALPSCTKKFATYTKVAIRAAVFAGEILEAKRGAAQEIVEKKGAANVVTESDIKAEKEIIRILRYEFPNHGILAEETKSEGVPENDYIWVVDPLDGSKNYSKGLPIYSISIALLLHGYPVCGVIYAPCLQQLFVADLTETYLNGELVTVSLTNQLGKALLASGYPYAVMENPLNCMEVENAMIQTGAQVDNLGTAVLHLAYVAAGIFDGKFHAGLRTWDVAAASLMIRNAGGVLTDWKGEPLNLLTLDMIDVVASNKHLHAKMLLKIREAQE